MAFSYFCLRSFALLGVQQQIGVQWNRYLIMRALFHECTNMLLIILVSVSVVETRVSAIKIAEAVDNF